MYSLRRRKMRRKRMMYLKHHGWLEDPKGKGLPPSLHSLDNEPSRFCQGIIIILLI
jgi:hypothetical protein